MVSDGLNELEDFIDSCQSTKILQEVQNLKNHADEQVCKKKKKKNGLLTFNYCTDKRSSYFSAWTLLSTKNGHVTCMYLLILVQFYIPY